MISDDSMELEEESKYKVRRPGLAGNTIATAASPLLRSEERWNPFGCAVQQYAPPCGCCCDRNLDSLSNAQSRGDALPFSTSHSSFPAFLTPTGRVLCLRKSSGAIFLKTSNTSASPPLFEDISATNHRPCFTCTPPHHRPWVDRRENLLDNEHDVLCTSCPIHMPTSPPSVHKHLSAILLVFTLPATFDRNTRTSSPLGLGNSRRCTGMFSRRLPLLHSPKFVWCDLVPHLQLATLPKQPLPEPGPHDLQGAA